MPTILIGLGTSGLRMLEETQRLFYGALGANKPDDVEMIFVETDSGVSRQQTPAGDAIVEQFIPLGGAARSLQFLRDSSFQPDTSWLPNPEKLTHAEAGAGGMRCFGRLALWSLPQNGAQVHLQQLEEKIRLAHGRLGYTRQLDIIIASSFAGGTGSGTFLDVAYLARFCVAPDGSDSVGIYGFFLLPPGFGPNQRMAANAYACLHDLDYYSRESSRFEARWPVAGRPRNGFDQGQTPFRLVTLMSPDWGGNQTLTYDHLVRLAGLFLFTGSLGFNDHRSGRIVDAMNLSGPGAFSKYAVVSISALVYPKLEIEETAAVDLSAEFLRKMIDSQNCYGHRISGNIEAELNRRPVDTEIDRIIRQAFAEMNDAGPDGSLVATVAKKVAAVEREEVADPPSDLQSFLRAGQGNTLYDFVRPTTPRARQVILDGVSGIVRRGIEESGSLTYGRRLLERCIHYLRSTVKFWQSFQVTLWDTRVKQLVDWSLSHTAKYIPGESGVILEQRMTAVLELLKMHHMLPSLETMCNVMAGEGHETAEFGDVPSLPLIDHIVGHTTWVCGAPSPGAGASHQQLETRRQRLSNRGRGPRQIHEHYPRGSFQGEVEAALTHFRLNPDPNVESEPESKRVFGYRTSLWDSLVEMKNTGKLRRELFQRPVESYMVRLRTKQSVAGLDIAGVIDDNANVLVQLAQHALEPPLMLNRVLQNAGQDYPKVIVTSEIGTQRQARAALQNNHFHDFADAGPHAFAECPQLTDMIILINERSDNFQPLRDITNIESWKANCENHDMGRIDAYGLLRRETPS